MPRTSERALLIPFCIATAGGGHRATVPPDSQLARSTLSGRVTSKPGRDSFRITLDATRPN